MAFNFRTFGVRAISSAFFVTLLLISVGWNYLSFSLFFLMVSVAALNEYFSLLRHMRVKTLPVSGYISGFVLYLLFVNRAVFTNTEMDSSMLLLALLIPALIAGVSVFSRSDDAVSASVFTTAGVIYGVLPFALLHLIVFDKGTNHYDPKTLLGVIFLIWSNDTFAYLSGNFFGKHKLVERISPGKTWEGTAGGLLITFGVSFLIRDHVIGGSGWLWPFLGILVPVLATIGDLIQSMLKRKAGVKDSGNIMPGHGGVLDRFDSLIFVSPFVTVLLLILQAH